jgi:hypothetical protein
MTTRRWLIVMLASTTMTVAFAQEPPAPGAKPAAPATPQTRPEDLEPAVDTSAQTLEPAVDTSATTRDVPAPSAATAPGASAAPATNSADTAEPAVNTSAPANAPAGTAARPRTGRALDRLELDSTQITGNRELPKVLYIVPWKRADLGDLVGKPVNSLLDEVLAPVDRDVFKRENRYYRALQPDAPKASGSAAAPAAQDER